MTEVSLVKGKLEGSISCMQPLKIRSFGDPKLDPVLHIKAYVSRTCYLRSSKRLFVTTMRP
jgi:hypothetical protein